MIWAWNSRIAIWSLGIFYPERAGFKDEAYARCGEEAGKKDNQKFS